MKATTPTDDKLFNFFQDLIIGLVKIEENRQFGWVIAQTVIFLNRLEEAGEIDWYGYDLCPSLPYVEISYRGIHTNGKIVKAEL
jgi:hypothetical protein